MTATRESSGGTAGSLPPQLAAKLSALRAIMGSFDGVLVAYSGGVDSTLLARVAFDALGDRALAVTAVSALMPRAEVEAASAVANQIGIRHRVEATRELHAEAFLANPPDRCYVCKGVRFRALARLAARERLAVVVHGENIDDASDYRPGARAATEAGVRAPLAEAGLAKRDVRQIAQALGLPNADKPAAPCLVTRIPYGRRVELAELAQVERGEAAIRRLGFSDVRVRHHGDVARVELPVGELRRAATDKLREAIVRELRAAGFRYVALDLQGFRSGSMNEALASGTGDRHG